jgi:ABC-type uncharacterized transport system substrate-binding protein
MRKHRAAALALCVLALTSAPARSHPHVYVDYEMALEVADDGVLRRIHFDWTFDDLYSAFLLQGAPRQAGDAREAALLRIAEDIVEKLEDVNYFTSVRASDHDLQTTGADGVRASLADGRLRLSFSVKMRALRADAERVALRVYDPQYIVAMSLKGEVRLAGPAHCRHSFTPAGPLDAADARQIEDSMRTNQLPAGFGAKLAGLVSIDCRAPR